MDGTRKIAIIGASYLQLPLILKAKKRGLETHVFAWAAGDVGETAADYFYPVSIIEKDKILDRCIEIGIDGICSIASDLASITVNYVAEKLNLTCNPMSVTEIATNKYTMRRRFKENGDPTPEYKLVSTIDDLKKLPFEFPVIVKPLDRSGSRGVSMVNVYEDLGAAIDRAKTEGFEKQALIEEYVTGQEYSVEYLSWKGKHHFLAITKKYTTGSPYFVETGHLQPAPISEALKEEIMLTVSHALNGLGIINGASHSELKISENGDIKLIEIGARMGGDCIGSDLVELSTGFDFVNAVIDVALGIEPHIRFSANRAAGIRFILNKNDRLSVRKLKDEHSEYIVREDIRPIKSKVVKDSSERYGYALFAGESTEVLSSFFENCG